jgi:hypothetical protein
MAPGEFDKVVLLAPDDNIVVTSQTSKAGEEVSIDSIRYTLEQTLTTGHKLARRDILEGEKILRYGAPIGRATQAIAAGEHVHVHNVASDYLRSQVARSGEAQ